jgi:hypothetical protein
MPVLERDEELLVDRLRLVVAGLATGRLLLEAPALIDGSLSSLKALPSSMPIATPARSAPPARVASGVASPVG